MRRPLRGTYRSIDCLAGMIRACARLLPLLAFAACATTTAGGGAPDATKAPAAAPPPAAAPAARSDSPLPPAGALTSAGMCPGSTDPTYGYTKENAIAVGGDWLAGPARAREYLQGLAGPDGQRIAFHRNGSSPFGDAILDEYQLSYDGAPKPILLYVDEYHYRELVAPVGLRCQRPIRLTRPEKGTSGLGN